MLPLAANLHYSSRPMIPRRHLVVLNPVAGKGKAAERIPEIEALLAGAGIDYELRVTQGVWHAAELARGAGAEGFDVVVAAGGDGTSNEVINGLMLAGERGEPLPALGGLSIGRGNDFAYGAGIPGSLGPCVEALAAGVERPLDVGRLVGGDFPQGRYFGNGIGVGFDTIVGLEAAKLRHVHGFMAYVIGALRTLALFPAAPLVRFEHDGGAIEQASHQISIMNGRRMGGTFFMAPDADDRDGLLDFCIAGRLTRRDMLALMLRYMKGEQAGHPKIRMGRSARYAISAPRGGLVVHADGETICVNGSSLVVECLGSRLRVVCGGDETRA
jgi:diacylglycerol kinase (ATP)